MKVYIDSDNVVDKELLEDWYINSVSDDEPVWTEAHIEELYNDFFLIPKREDICGPLIAADVQPVKHGFWLERPWLIGITNMCNICNSYSGIKHSYCPYCGARMDGGTDG